MKLKRWYVGTRHAVCCVSALGARGAARRFARLIERAAIARKVPILPIDHFGPPGAVCFMLDFTATPASTIEHPFRIFVLPWTFAAHDAFRRGEWADLLAETRAALAPSTCICNRCASYDGRPCQYQQSPQQKACAAFRERASIAAFETSEARA